MNLLEEMAWHLAFLGFGEVATRERDGNIFFGRLPEHEGLTVAVLAGDGGGPGRPAQLEIAVRAASDRAAFEACQGVAEACGEFDGYLMGDGRRASLRLKSGAHGLGADERRRPVYACALEARVC